MIPVADDEKASVRKALEDQGGCVEKIVDSLHLGESAVHGDDARVGAETQAPAQGFRGDPGRRNDGHDAVVDHRDLVRPISRLHEPAPHRLRVDQDVIGETADEPLNPFLHFRQVDAGIADRSHDERPAGHPGGEYGEDVGIKAVGMNDIDPPPPDVAGKAHLLPERDAIVEAVYPVLVERHPAGFHLGQELPEPLETGDRQVEAVPIDRPGQLHELFLGSSDGEGRHEFQKFDPLGRHGSVLEGASQ